MSSIEAFYRVASMQAQSAGAMEAGQISAEQLVTMESMKYATIVVTVFPITIAYPFLQRYFVKGLLVGHIKA
jgi:putative aldouronate transport system permease protein